MLKRAKCRYYTFCEKRKTEYVVNPDNYPGCNTDEERLALDVKNAKNDPFIMLGDDAEWSIVGEVVK